MIAILVILYSTNIGKLVLRNPLENTLATLCRSVRALLLEVNQSSFGKGPTPEAKQKSPVHPEQLGMRGMQPKRQMTITRRLSQICA